MNLPGRFAKEWLCLCAAGALFFVASARAEEGAGAPKAKTSPRVVKILVTDQGFEPSSIKVKAGEPLKLVVTRKTERTCAKEILIKDTDINVPLPLDKTVEIPFTPKQAGQIKYGCHMGMMIGGVFLVE